MAKYVDGFLFTVKKNRLKEYKKIAEIGAKVWMKHGALSYLECKADDLNPDMNGMKQMGFKKASKASKDEYIFFAFIVYKSKAHKIAVNKKVMKDPMMNNPDMCDPNNMPFEMKKFSCGGFEAYVEGK